MAVKNLMEDIVSALVSEVLSKIGGNSDEFNKDDIVTYVLNRIPPKYYTSERGILHGKIESQFIFQQKTDVLLLTHEAIKTIGKRRSSELLDTDDKGTKEFFLPHILGEVLEETTLSVVPDVRITLLFEDMPAEMIEPSWKNPYITNKATKGFFHFWPALSDDTGKFKPGSLKFSLICEHPQLEEKRINFEIDAVVSKNAYKSYVLPMILMEKIEGADLSFIED
jgi:competence protein ComFB